MAVARLHTRQPFATLDGSRLQSLESTKNRQNAVAHIPSMTTKLSLSAPSKRRASLLFEDDHDDENADPASLNSPAKRVKAVENIPKRNPRHRLATTVLLKPQNSCASTNMQPHSEPLFGTLGQRVSSSDTTKSSSNSIRARGGSPKHKRVGLLSKRPLSGPSFTRVDPPLFSRSSASNLPFSLDAALSGTISSYTPKPILDTCAQSPESMPKSWFFDIYEDTPEEEATNLMEHSACILDISSDDDCEAKRRNEAKERGKENIPPPDYFSNSTSTRTWPESVPKTPYTSKMDEVDAENGTKPPSQCNSDVAKEDRSPLSDLAPQDYYALECDSSGQAEQPVNEQSPFSNREKSFHFKLPVPRPCSEIAEATAESGFTVWREDPVSKEPYSEDGQTVNQFAVSCDISTSL